MSKIHIINAGPDVIVIHVQGRNGRAQQSSRQLLPGEHAECHVLATQYLQIASRAAEDSSKAVG